MTTQIDKTNLAITAIDAATAVTIKSASASQAENEVINHLLSTEGMSKTASLALLLATGNAIVESETPQ